MPRRCFCFRSRRIFSSEDELELLLDDELSPSELDDVPLELELPDLEPLFFLFGGLPFFALEAPYGFFLGGPFFFLLLSSLDEPLLLEDDDELELLDFLTFAFFFDLDLLESLLLLESSFFFSLDPFPPPPPAAIFLFPGLAPLDPAPSFFYDCEDVEELEDESLPLSFIGPPCAPPSPPLKWKKIFS